jgi:hypothetical protein
MTLVSVARLAGIAHAFALLWCLPALAQSKDAEPATRAANDAFVKSLPFPIAPISTTPGAGLSP